MTGLLARFTTNINRNKSSSYIRTKAAASDFSNSGLPLGIEYCYNGNQLIEIKNLTGNQPQHVRPLPVTVLAKIIKVEEMILVKTQTYIVIILNYYEKE